MYIWYIQYGTSKHTKYENVKLPVTALAGGKLFWREIHTSPVAYSIRHPTVEVKNDFWSFPHPCDDMVLEWLCHELLLPSPISDQVGKWR